MYCHNRKPRHVRPLVRAQDANREVGRIVARLRSSSNDRLPRRRCCRCRRRHPSSSSSSPPLSSSSSSSSSDPRGIPRERVTPPGKARSAHTRSTGGTTEVLEDAEQDRHALLWSLPLAFVFFTIVVVAVVTVGKGGHSLGAMECAPSLWLPWMAWRKRGECAMMVVGYGV